MADEDIAREVLSDDQYRLNGLQDVAFGTVVDVGAHIGCFARAVLSLHPVNRIIAFEPEPSNFDVLTQNLAAFTQAGRAQCHRMAVCGFSQPMALRRDANNTGAHRSLPEKGVGEQVRGASFEDLMRSIPEPRVGLLKLDCEGGEYPILAAATRDTLARIDLILMELHDTPELAALGSDPAWAVGRLSRSGFRPILLEDILYTDEGRFWILAAINTAGPNVDRLTRHYGSAELRYSGAAFHRLLGRFRRRQRENSLRNVASSSFWRGLVRLRQRWRYGRGSDV